MKAALAVLLSTLAIDPPQSRATDGQCSPELFRIARSKNANVVVYEAKLSSLGHLDPEAPVSASWLMLAAQGQREALTFLERTLAYGFEVRAASTGAGYLLKLRALEGRAVRVVETAACPAALASIGGREGILRRVFVKAQERALAPSVEYIELFGVEASTGAPLYERISSSPSPE